MSDNPLQVLADSYNESVKEIDKSGNAEKFKQATEIFFKNISGDEWYSREKEHFTAEDIEYLDGYFIFAHGTNAVVHFRINECPGWLFAIWWNEPSEEKPNNISGSFFAQYEETIDKFKPSRSNFCEEICYNLNNDGDNWDFPAYEIINFIHKEPYLAFCRDYHGWDYNTQFHSREEAEESYNKWREWHDNEVKYTRMNDDLLEEFVKTRILPLFSGSELQDGLGDCRDVVAPFSRNKHRVEKPGNYWWFADEEDEPEWIAAKRDYEALIEKCKRTAEKYNHTWYPKIHAGIYFYDDENNSTEEE